MEIVLDTSIHSNFCSNDYVVFFGSVEGEMCNFISIIFFQLYSQPLNYLHHMVNSPFTKEHVKCHSLLKINISLTIFEPNYFTSSELVVRNIICQTMYIIYFLSSY